jgi:serine/threonine-protein kinase
MPLITDSLGRVLGKRYRLVSALGAGASAHVFLAEDVSLQRHVAVKLLQPGLAADPSFLKRLSAEARSVASLNHPHVLRVFDWGEDADGPYLVTEYLSGGSLRDLLDRGVRLDHAQAARLGTEVAQGLAYAHARGLVHRDVKPANLLFDEEGLVRVADFGVARALAQAAWTEPEGAMVGTARYASPEQAEGRPVDGRADIYSLSLVLYETLTGEVPFVADTTLATLMARVGAPLPMHEALGPLGPVLARAAAPDVEERLTAAELAAELEAVASQLPAPAPLPIGQDTDPMGDDTTGVIDLRRGSVTGEVFDVEAVEAAEAWEPGDGSPMNAAGTATVVAGGRHSRRGGGAGEGSATVIGPSVGAEEEEPRPAEARAQAPPSHRRKRRRWPLVAAAVVIVAGLVAGGAVYAVHAKLFTPSHPVPSVTGQSVTAARQAVDHEHFTLALGPPQYSISVASGVVLGQSPRHGTVLKEGSTVRVVASKGPPPVNIPSLAQVDCSTAQRLLAASHLSGTCPAAAQVYNAGIPANQVINWAYGGKVNPSVAPYGAVITIAISKGPPPVAIANVTGPQSSYHSAAAALQGQGLTPAESQQYSTSVPAGQVVGTNPPMGTTVPHGSTVTVVVSAGPPLVQVPDVTGRTVTEATSLLHSAGVAVGQVYGPAHGKVFTTDPSAGASVQQGSAVNLYTK